MPLTAEHINLLFEACRAGDVPDGRDIPANALSFPYPVNPEDCLFGQNSWYAAHDKINEENNAQNRKYFNYFGGTVLVKGNRDFRQAFCLWFLETYYEFYIKKTGEYREFFKQREETRLEFGKQISKCLKPIEEKEMREEAGNESKLALAALFSGNKSGAEAHTEKAQKIQKQMAGHPGRNECCCLCRIRAKMGAIMTAEARAKRDVYEKEMRPLLEEYWLKANAMLGYVENANVRPGYEKRAIHLINKRALIDTLYDAGFEPEEAMRYRQKLNSWKRRLGRAIDDLVKQRDAEIKANKTEGGKLKDFVEKEKWAGNFIIKLPVGPDIYVNFGIDNGDLKAGYGAFGHGVMHSWNSDGSYSETLLTHISVLMPGNLGSMLGKAKEINDILKAGAAADYLKGKVNPLGSLPTFDRTKGEGKTYTYNQYGQQIDVATIRENSASVNWGPLGASQNTTTARHEGFLSSEVNTETKKSLTFGPFTIHE